MDCILQYPQYYTKVFFKCYFFVSNLNLEYFFMSVFIAEFRRVLWIKFKFAKTEMCHVSTRNVKSDSRNFFIVVMMHLIVITYVTKNRKNKQTVRL
jgi:hypothetical protein